MREASERLLAATDARRIELGKRWREVTAEAGLSHQTLARWRKGEGVDALTERAFERALMWGPGAREAITEGRMPRALDADSQGVAAAAPDAGAQDLELRADATADAIRNILDGLPADVREATLRRLDDRMRLRRIPENRGPEHNAG